MKQIKAPNNYGHQIDEMYSIFLAGSIEMGTAENWQERLVRELADFDVLVLNPRRDDWDSTWTQSIENERFREQVEWELLAQGDSNLIVMYFDPSTKSPITLLELGLSIRTQQMIVCCPDGYWKKGNVEVVCNWFGVKLTKTIDEFISAIRQELFEWFLEK